MAESASALHRGTITAPGATRSPTGLLPRDPFEEDERRRLWAMTAAERVAAMRGGHLTLRQCSWWAARRPGEVPRLNGEFEFIAIFDPEIAEASED